MYGDLNSLLRCGCYWLLGRLRSTQDRASSDRNEGKTVLEGVFWCLFAESVTSLVLWEFTPHGNHVSDLGISTRRTCAPDQLVDENFTEPRKYDIVQNGAFLNMRGLQNAQLLTQRRFESPVAPHKSGRQLRPELPFPPYVQKSLHTRRFVCLLTHGTFLTHSSLQEGFNLTYHSPTPANDFS